MVTFTRWEKNGLDRVYVNGLAIGPAKVWFEKKMILGDDCACLIVRADYMSFQLRDLIESEGRDILKEAFGIEEVSYAKLCELIVEGV